MTKFLEIVCNSVAVVLSTIFLPVQILMIIVLVIIEFPTTIFISKFKISFNFKIRTKNHLPKTLYII